MHREIFALAIASAAISSSASPALAREIPHATLIEHWKVDCTPADDEFSVGCIATAVMEGLSIRLTTADSQLFASVNVQGCPAANYANWWRDEISGRPDRRKLIERALNRILRETAQSCAKAQGRSVTFRWLPDIANVGDPPPEWVIMHGKPK